MAYQLRPAVREQTPLIIGLAGPTKSGKTLSAHRLAKGLSNGGKVVMINTEGPKGHLYADKFSYDTIDMQPPYSPENYREAVKVAAAAQPAVLIIDSMTHMHDGPGGMLEYHDAEIDRMAGQKKNDQQVRQRMTWAAWIKPKATENQFIYEVLNLKCHVVWCFRAKEKLKIVRGKEPVNMGWQPISSDRVSFETLFTLMLPPHCGGVPEMGLSELRTPFDTMITGDRPLDERLGVRLAEWARGGAATAKEGAPSAKATVTQPEQFESRAASSDSSTSSEAAKPEPNLHDPSQRPDFEPPEPDEQASEPVEERPKSSPGDVTNSRPAGEEVVRRLQMLNARSEVSMQDYGPLLPAGKSFAARIEAWIAENPGEDAAETLHGLAKERLAQGENQGAML